MDDIQEFDTVRIVAMIATPESHLAITGATRPPAIGDEGTFLDRLQAPTKDDRERIFIVESAAWLAVFRREELQVIFRPPREPAAG